MASLRTAMDAAFWDLDVSSPQALDGSAKLVPGSPAPLDGARASRALRFQQLSFLRNGIPLGIVPSFSPTPHKELGSFCLQSLLLRPATSNWWLGLVGQFRPKKLLSSIASEISLVDEWDPVVVKDVARHFLDKSLYSVGLCSQLALSPSTSVLVSAEKHGEKKKRRHKFALFHKLPKHDLIMEAAWPGLFTDHKGTYWDVPESISLDLLSLASETGFRYRVGVHKSTGQPHAASGVTSDVPSCLLPGICAKAAVSYEKSRDFWRIKEKKEDITIKTDKGDYLRPSYDVRLREPHAAVSGIIGGTVTAWLRNGESFSPAESREDGNLSPRTVKGSPMSSDLFGSLCYTYQHGKFRDLYGDLTRLDARLDINSASALVQRVFNGSRGSSLSSSQRSLSSPKLNFIFQQQVAGPILFRMDSRLSLGSSSEKRGPHIDDLVCSLSYSLRLLQSGKVVAWYSPKRKEGMVELRLFEF